MGDTERCADAALKVVQYGPDNGGAWVYLLRAHRDRRTCLPTWLLRECLRRFPGRAEIVNHAAAMLIAAGERARLIEVDPMDATAWSYHVMDPIHMGDADGTLGAIDRANRVASLERLGDPGAGNDTALAATIATALLRGQRGVHGVLSTLLSGGARTERYEDAQAFEVELIGHDPSWHEQLLLALALTVLGDLQSAQRLADLWYRAWSADASLTELNAQLDASTEPEPSTRSRVTGRGVPAGRRDGEKCRW